MTSHPLRRSTDNGKLNSFLAQLSRLKPVWYILAVGLLGLGFDFKTPAKHFQELESAISDANGRIAQAAAERREMQSRDKALEANQDTMAQALSRMTSYIRAVAIAECIDRPQRELQLMGLPCRQWLREEASH